MEVKEQLRRLARLQQVVSGIRQAQEIVERAPGRLEEIEQRFRDRNAEYVAVKDRFDALDTDQRLRSAELEELQEHRAKYAEDRKRVQNEREYAAILREIDTVESRIAEHEEAILKDMEEIEVVKGELQTHEEHIKTERELVDREAVEVKAATEESQTSIQSLEIERSGIESELPRELVRAVKRLEAGRQGVFLAEAEDGTCQSCFVRVRPQVFQEIKLAIRVHTCSNCRRLLFHARSIEPARAEGGSEIGAANGGAI